METALLDTFHALFLAFVLSILFAPLMIRYLYKTNQVAAHKKAKLGGGIDEDNSLYLRIMNVSGKNGIPNMGGIMVWVIVPLTAFLTIELTPLVKVMLWAFILFGSWGFLDVLFTNMIKNNPDLKTIQERFGVRLFRFASAVLLNMVVTYMLWSTDLISEISIFGLSIAFTVVMIPILAVIGQFAIYASELTDGLDGLMIGIFGIVYTAIGAMLLIQGKYELLPLIGIIIGVILVDLYFNINPARFYNGGPSAMPLGLTAFLIGLATTDLIPYFFISSITWVILASSMIQIVSMRFFKRRVFKMAPLHHHFQTIGWPETKVTMRFWLITMVSSIIGIYLSIVL